MGRRSGVARSVVLLGAAALLAASCGKAREPAGSAGAKSESGSGAMTAAGPAGAGSSGAREAMDAGAGAPAVFITADTNASCTTGADAGADDAGLDVALGDGDLTVLLVFDKSTSMDWAWDHRSRWYAASEAMVSALQPYLSNLTIGAIMFPQLELCAVAPLGHEVQFDYQPGAEFIDSWLQRVCHPHDAWGTPLELAFREADAAIERAYDLGLLEDRFRVLLVTDGEPTCDDDPAAIVDYPRRWAELGVETYVIGLPGSEPAASLLDEIAAAGGTESYLAPGTPDDFAAGVAVVAE